MFMALAMLPRVARPAQWQNRDDIRFSMTRNGVGSRQLNHACSSTPAEGLQPLTDGQRSFLVVVQRRNQVEVLDEPAPAFAPLDGRLGLIREIEIQRARNVVIVLRHEQPERLADARVDVEHLVLAVARVEAIADVENALIPDGLHEIGRGRRDRLVPAALAERCAPDVHGKLSNLVAGESDETIRLPVEVAVEDEDLIVAAGDVFLQHQVRMLGIFHLLICLE